MVGIEALSHEDLLHLEFMEKFERQFVKQGAGACLQSVNSHVHWLTHTGDREPDLRPTNVSFTGAYENRTIFDSLAIAWELLRTFPKELLKRVKVDNLDKYYKRS